MTAPKHPTYSHLKDDYWTTSTPAPVGYVPDGQTVGEATNEAQGDTGPAPVVVKADVDTEKPAAAAKKK